MSNTTADDGLRLLSPVIANEVQQLLMGEVRFQFAGIVSESMQTEAPAMMQEVLYTQGAGTIWNSLRKQIDDIIIAFFRVQTVKIVRSTVDERVDDLVGDSLRAQTAGIVRTTEVEQADNVVKGLVDSQFSPTSRDWVFNEIVGTVSTVVCQDIVNHTQRHNMVPGAPDKVAMVAGVPAHPWPPRSSGDSDDPQPSSPRGCRRSHHGDRRLGSYQ